MTKRGITLTQKTHTGMKPHLFILVAILDAASGFPRFQSLIPNGDGVRDPCDKSAWQGVGHWAKGGGGTRNPFGEAFQRNRMVWTQALCQADSDGDGKSNGFELGDPDCRWRPGMEPTGLPVGHPGICENWRTPECQRRNGNQFTCTSSGLQCLAINGPDVRQIQFRMPRTTIPATDFTYMCVNLEFPTDRDYHIIADTGVLDNQNALHHQVIFGCTKGVTAAELQHPVGTPYPCEMLPDPKCQDFITGWQPGIPGFCHPENIGFSVGANGVRYGALQLHWINPLRRTDMTDTSGMALYLTPHLRQFNLSVLTVGEFTFTIPPGEKSFSLTGNCASTCTSRQLTGPIHVYQGFDHMHYAGKEMKVALKRRGTGPEMTLWNNPFFSFQTTAFHKMEPIRQIRPGDSLHTTCKYNTESRNKTTFFGNRAVDEMCFAFLQFYPAENALSTSCSSIGGIPRCQINDPTAVIDGCSTSFASSNDIEVMKKFLKDNCNPLQCLKECVNVVKAIRKHACFRKENIRRLVEQRLLQLNLIDTLALLHSCDVEIAKETLCPGKQANPGIKSTRCLCNKRPYLRWIN